VCVRFWVTSHLFLCCHTWKKRRTLRQRRRESSKQEQELQQKTGRDKKVILKLQRMLTLETLFCDTLLLPSLSLKRPLSC
jgi:uncharacterized SAM-binding protein YcdF (DUF218 family)